MQTYLDNSATTRIFDSVKDKVISAMMEDYGNPSAMHIKGVEAEGYVIEAKKTLARLMKVEDKEIIFTSGGTESNNLALIGAAFANRRRGRHIITSSVEHPSVTNTVRYLSEQGFTVTWLPADKNGLVDLEALKEAVTVDTILVSVMYVNNEMGAVEPIEAISRIIKEKNPLVIFHVDGVQAFGKYKIYPKRQGIDLLSVSGHKIHAPKGVGFLYLNSKIKIKPVSFGGGQQDNLRSGTLNVPGIAGLSKAAEEIYKNHEARIGKLYAIKKAFTDGLLTMEDVKIIGLYDESSAPHIVSAAFGGIKSEVLLHALEDRGIFVSSGSACSSHKGGISNTIKAIGVEKEYQDSILRFSFSVFTEMEEIEYCLKVLGELVPVLRKYRRH